MRSIVILLLVLLVGCSVPYSDDTVYPDDFNRAQALCAGLGGLAKVHLARWYTEDNKPYKRVMRAVCNNGSSVMHTEAL